MVRIAVSFEEEKAMYYGQEHWRTGICDVNRNRMPEWCGMGGESKGGVVHWVPTRISYIIIMLE